MADHWFQQVDRILEAMEITSDATQIRLATFQLEGESQVWWDWVRALRDLEAMTWEELCGLFMEKYFPALIRLWQIGCSGTNNIYKPKFLLLP